MRRVSLHGMVLALVCMLSATSARAASAKEAAVSLAKELRAPVAAAAKGTPVLLAPLKAAADDSAARAFQEALAAALVSEARLKLVEEGALKAALQEAQLGAADLERAMADLAGGFGAKVVIMGEVVGAGAEKTANVRAVLVGDATVVAGGRATFGGDDVDSSREATTLTAQLRRLSDKIRSGLDKLDGDARYQTFAVLQFDEVGATTKEKQLGLLVSSELTTLLRRDHNLMMVERSQLAKVIEELALGQTGLVDESKSVEVGKLAGAQGLVMGSVSEAGGRYLVNAKVVSTVDGNLAVAEQVELPAADLVALSSEAVVLRSTAGSVYRSILMPGWGQVYNRQPIKGAAFVAGEVLGIGLAASFHLLGAKKEDKYNSLGSGTDPEVFRRVLDKSESYYQRRNLFIYATVALHAINILDAFIYGKTFDTANPGGVAGGSGLTLTY